MARFHRYKLYFINPALTAVHGQHPVNPKGRILEGAENSHYLVRVPRWFNVEPLIQSKSEPPQPQIACNYSIPKTVIAIVQVGYSTYGLWQVSGKLIDKYGYGAYSLTVIPYILLTFVNLLANLCQPQYPSMFLVSYEETEENQQMGNTETEGSGSEVSTAKGLATARNGQQVDLDIKGEVGRATGKAPSKRERKQGLLREAKVRKEKVSETVLHP